MIYDYSTSEFEIVKKTMVPYLNDGDIINVYNKMTDKITSYVVETKKVLTITSKNLEK